MWEWACSQWEGYPYASADGREDVSVYAGRMVRGGAFDVDARLVRCAFRDGFDPLSGSRNYGFRVVNAFVGCAPLAIAATTDND